MRGICDVCDALRPSTRVPGRSAPVASKTVLALRMTIHCVLPVGCAGKVMRPENTYAGAMLTSVPGVAALMAV
jgi:hypothetical protein